MSLGTHEPDAAHSDQLPAVRTVQLAYTVELRADTITKWTYTERAAGRRAAGGDGLERATGAAGAGGGGDLRAGAGGLAAERRVGRGPGPVARTHLRPRGRRAGTLTRRQVCPRAPHAYTHRAALCSPMLALSEL